MSPTLTKRILIAIGEVSLIVAALLVAPTWSTAPASATVYSPGLVSVTAPPTGILFDSPWIVGSNGTQWTYATTVDKMGTLVSRNPTTGVFSTTPIAAGDEGSVAGIYSPQTNVAVFSVRRTGLHRMISFNLTTRARLSSRPLTEGETNIRALAFNSSSASFIIGSKHTPPIVSKFESAGGYFDFSRTLSSSAGEITSFIPNGTNLLATIDSSPVALVPVSSSTLTVGTPIDLPAETPTILDPIVSGTTAFVGTDATPGRITAIDIPTKTVIGSITLNDDESGARNLLVDPATGTLYATTETTAGTRLLSFTSADLVRRGQVELGAGTSATDLLLHGQRLSVAFAGARGFVTLSTAPAPESPRELAIDETDRALSVSWAPGSSVEPVVDYTVTAVGGGQEVSCTTTDTHCQISGLTNGIEYAVSVVARSLAGKSLATIGAGNPFTVPQPPSAPEVVSGNTELRATWIPGDSGGRPVMYFTATANPSGVSCIAIVSSCVLSGIPNGVAQTVTVITRTSAGESVASAASDTIKPATVPDAPDNVVVTELDGGVELAWSTPSDDGGDSITGYRLEVWAAGNRVHVSETAETTRTIDGLRNGVIHRFVVWAVNGVGGGTPVTIFGTPTAPPTPDPPVVDPPVVDPDTPTPPNLSAAPGTPVAISVLSQSRKHVTVGWSMTDVGSAPVVDFVIQTSRFASRGFRTIDDGVTTNTWVHIRKPKRGSLYLRVRAVNAVGESPVSAAKRVIRR
jgi:hypothetical protein